MEKNLADSKTSTFSDYRKLLKVSLEYSQGSIQPFQGCVVVGMQDMLGTTIDMFRVMKRLGLEQAVVGSKLFSDSQVCIEAFKKLGYSYIGCQEPTGYGLYNQSVVTLRSICLEGDFLLISKTQFIRSLRKKFGQSEQG